MSDVILEEACLQTSVVVGKRVTLGWAYGQSDWAYGHTNGKDNQSLLLFLYVT
jgi:hypothetical protein